MLDPYLTPYTKINSKWINHPNVRAKSITLVEENKSLNFRFYIGFLSITPKSTSDKRKLDKVDLIKIKNLGASKDIIKKVEIQHTE